jgi:hypothetical protein
MVKLLDCRNEFNFKKKISAKSTAKFPAVSHTLVPSSNQNFILEKISYSDVNESVFPPSRADANKARAENFLFISSKGLKLTQ